MIEVSSFLSGKNLCNIFADLIVKEINKVSPDAITEIKVINVRSFFIVKGFTSSEKIVNLSDILSDLYQSYDENLVKTVRVIDVIIYNKKIDRKLNINVQNSNQTKKIKDDLLVICNKLQKEGFYLNLKVHDKNLFYDFEHNVEYDHDYISSNFKDYNCVKDDFSNDVYISDLVYGLSDNGEKYYHFLLNKISFNLLNRGFSSDLNLLITSENGVDDIDSENINLSVINKTTISKEKLESLILDNFSFKLSDIKNEFDLSEFNLLSYLSEVNYVPSWENYQGTRDLMFL
jgi:hypothetical protein